MEPRDVHASGGKECVGDKVGVEREVGVPEGVEWCGANKKGEKGGSESAAQLECLMLDGAEKHVQ